MPTSTDLNNAIYRGKTELVESLLKLPIIIKTIADKAKDALSIAVERGHLDIVKLLLKHPECVAAISLNEHYALNKSLDQKDFKISILLLKSYGKQPIPLSIVEKIQEIDPAHEYSKKLKSALFKRIISVKRFHTPHGEKGRWLAAWISYWKLAPWSSELDINPLSFSDYLFHQFLLCKDPAQASILLSCLNANAKNFKAQRDGIQLRGINMRNFRDYNNDNWFRIFNSVYKEVIEPEFVLKFNEAGGLEGVENIIKKAILDNIEPDDNIKINFEHPLSCSLTKNELIYSKDLEHRNVRYDGFRNPNDMNCRAWRAMNDQHRSISVRTMIAYYYLVASDQRLNSEHVTKAVAAFWNALDCVQQLIELDNDMSIIDEGVCISFLHNVVTANPFLIDSSTDFYSKLKDVIQSEFKKELVDVLITYDSAHTHSSFEALTASKGETTDYLQAQGSLFNDVQMFTHWRDFISRFWAGKPEAEPLFERLKGAMLKKHKIVLTHLDRMFVHSLLIDRDGWDAQADIKAAYEQRIKTLNNNNSHIPRLFRPSLSSASSVPHVLPELSVHNKPSSTMKTNFV